ncbi:DUF202 domain-containing protein [Rothia terrae]|uniref:DUF202 domain-containing protein n=1 Tax=Rothia terrae TaxID=396015 RepID=UPI0014467EBC|nr:DUF202 domain-containing protein [Rothia terrae]MDT0189444.1 DUF202 domain-containing protein [Rothia terrae]NKZ34211.1 DUF202 domain-containing protein [Rothia terrae]
MARFFSRPSRLDSLSDKRLQPERTSLSWTRTCLSLFVLILVQLRFGHFSPAVTLLLFALVAVLFSTATARYERQSRGILQEHYPPNTAAVLGLGAVVFLASIVLLIQAA